MNPSLLHKVKEVVAALSPFQHRFIQSGICLLMIFMMSSCSNNLKYFTQDMYRDFGWSNKELQRIQFYLSQDIVLYRELGQDNARISRGKITVQDDREVEEVIIPAGTPGVFLQSPAANKFAVSFDANDEDKYLMFGPGKLTNGKYTLLAKEWNRNSGLITYGNKLYKTRSESAYAALMVDIDKAQKVKVRKKQASGNRVRGSR